uniref:Uncharacterized protein n=1 Tax=Physcomitrium patens TaxID=3218 RepID=A0A2K1JRR0_PHYPA|nr:hypothetical protein PHYPA_016530 [Physcomitrium patens]
MKPGSELVGVSDSCYLPRSLKHIRHFIANSRPTLRFLARRQSKDAAPQHSISQTASPYRLECLLNEDHHELVARNDNHVFPYQLNSDITVTLISFILLLFQASFIVLLCL